MSESPFAFLRGAAIVMAHDLAGTPSTGLNVDACGDAHVANFGLFGTPERNLVFDVTDFDETLPAPWEWDLKRLVASVVVAGREGRRHTAKERAASAGACVRSYRERMGQMASWGQLKVWYSRVDAEALRPVLAETRQQADDTLARTRRSSSLDQLAKLTEEVDGTPRFREDPPIVVRTGVDTLDLPAVTELLSQYRESLPPDRRILLDRFTVVDVARKAVGVGSVGTRCHVVLLAGGSLKDPLFLQVKECGVSVLERVSEPSAYSHHGERVVMGQRCSQAASDIFLGWGSGADGRDYYLRQLRDMKYSVAIEDLSSPQLTKYATACGWALARAHARSGDRNAIASYAGSSNRFDQALVRFAEAYADQTERDHAAFVAATPRPSGHRASVR